jgi:hypothetical protein
MRAPRPLRKAFGRRVAVGLPERIALAVLLGASPLPVLAQNPEADPPAAPSGDSLNPVRVPGLGAERWVGGVVSMGGGATMVAGSALALASVRVQLQVSPSVRLGAEGVRSVGGVRTSPDSSPDRSELRLGYGGLRADVQLRQSRWSGSLLLAAGVARVRSPLLQADLASRNSPPRGAGLQRLLGQLGPLRFRASASARLPLGSPSLPGVRSGDLFGGTFGLNLEWIRAP